MCPTAILLALLAGPGGPAIAAAPPDPGRGAARSGCRRMQNLSIPALDVVVRKRREHE
tara:strand:- start:1146 stop:1319 length:174 start_codon:yes stop_codon:yes gene_type:complete